VRWTNNVTAKLIGSGICSVMRLRKVIQNETLNVIISKRGKPKFNKVTIIGIDSTLKSDFHQGRFLIGRIDCPIFLLTPGGPNPYMDFVLPHGALCHAVC
jgi:hypothetical protein